MADYSVTFAKSARKELEALSVYVVERVWARVELLLRNPRPTRCRKLEWTKDMWRIRVGQHRVIYSVDDVSRAVDVLVVRHRKDAYLMAHESRQRLSQSA